MIVVDEFHNINPTHASHLSSVLQSVSEYQEKQLAFVGAGLAQMKHGLLNHPGFTFFRRSHHDDVDHISIADAINALQLPLQDHAVRISDKNVERAARATKGLCYAIQSIGSHIWNVSGGAHAKVTDKDVDAAITRMNYDVADKVISPIWSRLSVHDKMFLFAMLEDVDVGLSKLSNIRARLQKSPAHVAVYKSRLLDEGVLAETAYGDLMFTNPGVAHRAAEELAVIDTSRSA